MSTGKPAIGLIIFLLPLGFLHDGIGCDHHGFHTMGRLEGRGAVEKRIAAVKRIRQHSKAHVSDGDSRCRAFFFTEPQSLPS